MYNINLMDIDTLLRIMVEKNASDLHLTAGTSPVLRIDGLLRKLNDFPPLTGTDIETFFHHIATAEQIDYFKRELELDFAYTIPQLARFRINVMRQKGTVSLAFRLVPLEPPSIDKLALPQVLKSLIMKPRGLILVTGASGTGKSTTLAAMINYLNETTERNIITIEDPIEFVFENRRSIIRQRELGYDTRSFANALTYALRHNPDVIVVGEMRDLATMTAALRAAETGHLVLGTLHTIDAPQTIDRIVDLFPAVQQKQVRIQLSSVIEALLSQRLVRKLDGGRIAAFEIVLANSVIRKFILEQRVEEILPNAQMSRLEGMQTMEQALADLVNNRIISIEEAMATCNDPNTLRKLIRV